MSQSQRSATGAAAAQQHQVVATKRPKSGNKGKKIQFWAPECKYVVILDLVRALPNWKLVSNEKLEQKCNLFWVDVATIGERFKTVQPWQCVNHFPGMPNIARKAKMGQNLNRMLKVFPKDYAYYPRTWVLPHELNDFRQQFDGSGNSIGNKVFIIKPDAGCQGRGIFLTKTWDSVPQNESVVAQLYIVKPLLLDGYKFDLRVYCLITGVKPLRMYMFQDGLVRMCTETYVKPTKQNISQSCMHLTNYAVNKNNDGFVQPSADSSDNNEGQDDASKRSLKWFMDWFRENYGDEKAGLIWKRIGTVIVRTVLSILPTLGREYDQHFKSFNNIPRKFTPKSYYADNLSSMETYASESCSKTSNSGRSTKQSRRDEDEDHEESANNSGAENEEEDEDDGGGDDAENEEDENGNSYPHPQDRGSRCFEILGLDILIDKNLKAWLIEVNHLPSFGTDSPLDLDIKERLMQQVFQVLPTMGDDEEAYSQYHKEQAGKRLTQEKRLSKAAIEQKEREEREKKERERKAKAKAYVLPPKPKPVAEPPPVALIVPDAPPSIARVNEIKEELETIYLEYCPEKVSKIDKLLSKYMTREEEFLQFVIEKYGVVQYKKSPEPPLIVPDPGFESISSSASVSQQEEENSQSEEDKSVPMLIPRPPSLKDARRASITAPPKRHSRSLSPDSGQQSQRRASAIWKSNPDDDTAFRNEILSQFVPKEDDPWMAWESQFLTQFTRIFPKLPSKETDLAEEDDEGKDDEDETDKVEDSAVPPPYGGTQNSTVVTSVPKRKAVSFEDIIVEVFLQDRRQTMRMYCPLPNKARAMPADNQSLPPLETSKGHLPGSIAAGLAKAGGGWRAPPKSEKVSSGPVQLNPSQIEAATRLSQGLSVKPLETVSVKKDQTFSASTAGMLINFAQNQIAGYDNDDLMSLAASVNLDAVDIPPRVKRLMEQKRLIRMKYENSRNAHQASVLRQQVYRFDQSTSGNIVPGAQYILDQQSQIQPSAPQARPTAYGLTGSSVVSSSSTSGMPGLPFRNSNVMIGAGMSGAGLDRVPYSSLRQQQGSRDIRSSSISQQPVLVRHLEHNQQSAKQPQKDYGGVKITDQLSREEMLKHLFPGWF